VLQVIISERMRGSKNMFRQKLCDIEGGYDIRGYHWFDYQGQSKDTLNFLNEIPYFLLHIL